MKTYGYCRISTGTQNLERQVRNIQSVYPDAIIVREVYTGRKFQGRKEFEKILKVVTDQDRIVCDSVSRMSRSAEEGCREYEELFRRGITLEFLKEPHINTEVYKQALNRQINLTIRTGNKATDTFMNTVIDALNSYIIELAKEQIRIAFLQAEKEVQDLRQRTREGIETARLNGKQIGQLSGRKLHIKKKEPMKEEIRKKSKFFDGILSDKDLIKILGISRNTFYKYKKELTEE